jgi:hypothetical protein
MDHKFVMATIGCGIAHKYTKHTDKCSNNYVKRTQKESEETRDKYFQAIMKIIQKSLTNCTHMHFP